MAQETDVAYLKFEKEFEDANFVCNAAVAILLDSLKQNNPDTQYPPAFEAALQYAKRFKGAVQIQDPAAIDEVFASLNSLEFSRVLDDGTEERLRLHRYEVVALTNLNPGSVPAAKSLIPSLDKYTDEEVEEALKHLRRASAKYAAT